MIIRSQYYRLAAPLAAALALAACRPSGQEAAAGNNAAQALPPLSQGAATASANAPAAAALPAVQPLAYSYAEAPGAGGYGWIDQADLLLDTIGDAPPDYAFDYDGVEPWAWQTADDYEVYAEPIDGGWRYYYYAPGTFEPFLVRDPAYSYGYRNGRVAAVYGADGRYLARAAALRQAEAASRYYARARALRAAARSRDRRPVASARWADQRQAVVAARRQWDQAREHEDSWRRYRADRQATIVQRAGERAARAAAAERFANWQQARFRGPPPRLYGGRPDQPAAQVLARRETAARQSETRRQAQAQAEAGRRAAAMARAQARTGEVRAQQAAELGAREAQARQRAAARGAGAPAAAALARQRALAEANVRQRQQAQAQAQVQAQRRAAQAQTQAQRRAAQAQQQAQRRTAQVQAQAQRRAAQVQAQAQRRAAQVQQQAAQAQRRAAAARAAAAGRQRAAAQAQQHAIRAQAQIRQQAARAQQRAVQAQRQRAAQAIHARPAVQVPRVTPAPHRPARPAAAAPAGRRPDREGHGRGH